MELTDSPDHLPSVNPDGSCGCAALDGMDAARPGKPKILVVIANHGTKNRPFLDRLLVEYRSMERLDVNIVVLSNIPKELGPDVEVKVGLPVRNPFSLPFGYKKLFAEHASEYDLFIYTEDDILITEKNIEAFVEESRVLPEEYIAGFMRYEVSSGGRKAYPDMHSHFHWDPNSVIRSGNSLFAHHTNEHAACFILTRRQLQKAVNSGGWLLPPRRGRYDMRETAATDPYTQCGMKKLICISRIDDFSLHHLPNAYLGELGLDAQCGKLEIDCLESLAEKGSARLRGPLFEPYPLRDRDLWNKKYYENPRDDVLNRVPRDARRVLSVGCGCGATEEALANRGVEVVAIPLDSVIGTTAAARGIAMLSPDFELAAHELEGQQFDCILMMDILQQLRDPVAIVSRYRALLRDGGSLLVSVPNWNYLGMLRQRLTASGRAGLECRATRHRVGVHRTTKSLVAGWLRQGGFGGIRHGGVPTARTGWISKRTFGWADGFLCRNLLVSAQR